MIRASLSPTPIWRWRQANLTILSMPFWTLRITYSYTLFSIGQFNKANVCLSSASVNYLTDIGQCLNTAFLANRHSTTPLCVTEIFWRIVFLIHFSNNFGKLTLFKRMLANQHHVLQPILPDQSSHNYNLHNRRHQLQLTQKTTHFNNKLFIIRLLFKDTY